MEAEHSLLLNLSTHHSLSAVLNRGFAEVSGKQDGVTDHGGCLPDMMERQNVSAVTNGESHKSFLHFFLFLCVMAKKKK